MHYVPNAEQVPIHQSQNDVDFTSGGWRSGKSVVVAAEALPHVLIPSPKPYLAAFIGPTYLEPREEMAYIRDWLTEMLPERQFSPTRDCSWPQEGKVTIQIPPQKDPKTGELIHFGTIKSYTADEAERIRAFNADFVVVCEAGGLSEESFFNLIGRVLSTGGFIIGSGTLEFSQKWYHNIIKEGLHGVSERGIRSFILPSWANTKVFEGGRNDPKILRAEKLLPADLFAVRIGAQPVRMTGVAVKEASVEHHVTPDAEYNPMLPVELAIDPGYTGAYSVLALQYYDNGIKIVDEVYERFLSTPQIVEICKARPWWNGVQADNPGVIDRAAKQHSPTDGRSVLEIWYEESGLWFDLTEGVIPVDTGLEQLRIHLNIQHRIQIFTSCQGLLGEWDLGSFPDGFEHDEPWHYRSDPQGRLRGDTALTGADHSSTALIYWLIHRFGYITQDTMEFGSEPLVWSMPDVDEYGAFQNGVAMGMLSDDATPMSIGVGDDYGPR